MNNQIFEKQCLITAIIIIASMSLYHYLKNYLSYSGLNRLGLPVAYTSSVLFLFNVGHSSVWYVYLAFFALITVVKCMYYTDHVRQMVWDFSGPGFRKNPKIYIILNDAMALILILAIKAFFWMHTL